MIVRRLAVTLAIVLATVAAAAAQSTKAAEIAVKALEEGDGDKAAAAFAEALVQSPRDPRLHLGAGIAARLRGRDNDAKKAMERALELEPRFTAASQLLGELAYEQGDVDLAIRTYERASKHAPLNRAMTSRLSAWRDEASKERRVDGPFTIAFDGPAEARLAAHATAVLDAAYWRIGKSLGGYPSNPITVVFHTLKQFRAVTGAPEWAGGAFDTRIRIPVRNALATPQAFDRVLTHELVHAMIAGFATRGVPAWLHEGLATRLEPGDASNALGRLRARRTFVPLAYLEDGFDRLDERQAVVAYDESTVAAHMLLERIGPNVTILLDSLGRGQDMTTALAQFGLSYSDFEKSVSARVRSVHP